MWTQMYCENADDVRSLVGSVAAHSVEDGRSSSVPWPLSRQRAYSSLQAVPFHHLVIHHLSPKVYDLYLPKIQGIYKDSVTGGDVRLKGHGPRVTRGTLGSTLPTRHYAIFINCRTSVLWYKPQIWHLCLLSSASTPRTLCKQI